MTVRGRRLAGYELSNRTSAETDLALPTIYANLANRASAIERRRGRRLRTLPLWTVLPIAAEVGF